MVASSVTDSRQAGAPLGGDERRMAQTSSAHAKVAVRAFKLIIFHIGKLQISLSEAPAAGSGAL
jgi:hypothetical protein